MGSFKDEPLQVLIPYKTLVRLLEASKEIESLRSDQKNTNRQLAALRGQMYEIIDKLRSN